MPYRQTGSTARRRQVHKQRGLLRLAAEMWRGHQKSMSNPEQYRRLMRHMNKSYNSGSSTYPQSNQATQTNTIAQYKVQTAYRGSQTCGIERTFPLLQPQTLYNRPIQFPSAVNNVSGSSSIVPNGARASSHIHVVGIQQQHIFSNRFPIPVRLHVATLQLKEDIDVEDTENAISPGFFRNNNRDGNRNRNFVNAPNPADLWQFYLDRSRINPDRFNVLSHEKFVLDAKNRSTDYNLTISNEGPDETVSGQTSANISMRQSPYVLRYNRWLPINKTMNFERPQDFHPTRPITFVYWYGPVDPNDWSILSSTAEGSVTHQDYNVVYFKD